MDVYLDEHRFRYNPRPDSLNRALEAARRAVELDPTSSRARQSLALTYFFRRQLDLFFVEAERAMALDPNDDETLANMGLHLACAGRWDRGVALAKKAIALTPNPPGWYYFVLADDHYRKGEYEDALAATRKAGLPEFFWTHLYFAMAYGQLGRAEEARASIAELQRLKPDFTLDTARYYVSVYYVEEEVVEHWLDGLRKAGLK